jgi:hypothetical protein
MCRPGGSNPVIANVEHTKNSDLVLTARRAENKCAKTLKCGAGLGRQGSALFIFYEMTIDELLLNVVPVRKEYTAQMHGCTYTCGHVPAMLNERTPL